MDSGLVTRLKIGVLVLVENVILRQSKLATNYENNFLVAFKYLDPIVTTMLRQKTHT